MTILAVHNWSGNAALIADVAQLGYLDGTVLDATYGKHGGFWKLWRPEALTTNDLNHPADHSWDFRSMPIPGGSFDAVVFDPDYKLNGTPAVGEMDERYGTDENLSRAERLEKIRLGALECFRVARQRLLVKCMDQVEGGQVRWQTDIVTRAVEEAGGRKVDRFDLIGHGRAQPSGRRQLTAQGRGSTLLVFSKPPARVPGGQASLL